MQIINLKMVSHPINWLTILLMVLIMCNTMFYITESQAVLSCERRSLDFDGLPGAPGQLLFVNNQNARQQFDFMVGERSGCS